MAKPSSSDWIVGDSEDEDDVYINPGPTDKASSTISSFQTDIPVFNVERSIILQFAEKTNTMSIESTHNTDTRPSAPTYPPAKAPPRPRPAYVVDASIDPFMPSISLSQFYADDEVHDPSSSTNLPVDAGRKESSSDPSVQPSSRVPSKAKHTNFVMLPSDDEQPVEYNVPVITQLVTPAPSDYSHPTWSDPVASLPTAPTAHHSSTSSAKSLDITPPSSPVTIKKRKRPRAVMEDLSDDLNYSSEPKNSQVPAIPQYLDEIAGTLTSPVVKESRTLAKKPRKPREKKTPANGTKAKGKGKKGTSLDNAPTSIDDVANHTVKQVEYKSKEYVDDSSDDDLALLPSSNKRVRPDRQDIQPPTSTESAVDTQKQPPHVVPAQPTVFVSVPPMQFGSPPTHLTITPLSSSSQEKEAAATPHNMHMPCVDLPPGGDSIATTNKKKAATKGKGKGKQKVQDVSEPPMAGEGLSEVPKTTTIRKGKKRAVVDSEDEEYMKPAEDPTEDSAEPKGVRGDVPDVIASQSEQNKENDDPKPACNPISTPTAPKPPKPRLSEPHSIPRKGSMSELIRRVSSRTNSPFGSPSPGTPTYDPHRKFSRSYLSKMAPLHANRRTPPPPPPRPPPPKKSKKMLELEEKWEEELAEEVEGWTCLGEEERAVLRRAKRDRELGYDD